MIIDRLILHHTYRGTSAFDASGNRNHGIIEGDVLQAGGQAHLYGGPDCIRVPASPSLSGLRAIRVEVRFYWDPDAGEPARRHDLIGGYLSFGFFIDTDRSLNGTTLDRWGNWTGAFSAANAVTPRRWHTATFVHDGISACRVDLDGATLAENYDVPGPVAGVQEPYGVAIGHWTDPDDRYSFIGDIREVKLWIDRPEVIREAFEPCCCDNGSLTDALGDLRSRSDFRAEDYRDAAETLLDLGSRAFGRMAAGSATDRDAALELARRFTLAARTSDRAGLIDTLTAGMALQSAKIAAPELAQMQARLVEALSPTILGDFLSALTDRQVTEDSEIRSTAAELGVLPWIQGFCLDWVFAPPRGRDWVPHEASPSAGRDPSVDLPVTEPPPQWGGGDVSYLDADQPDDPE